MSANVTKHGERRMRGRLGLPKKTVARMADKALVDGKRHSDFSGSFKRYLDYLFLKHGKANNMRVFQKHVFIFAGEPLITVLPVPGKYRKAA